MNPTFWQNKRVLVTGHTGFKGSWLSVWLRKMGAEVYGFALAPITDPSLFELANMAEHVHSTLGDIRHKDDLNAAVSAAQPEIIFHLAAQPLVRQSYKDPLSTIETNVMGAAHLLECVRQTSSVKAVVVITSDKCYENNESPTGYSELEPLGGHDPYSASKACVELLTQSWQKSFFQAQADNSNSSCAVATARAGNVIGGGDWSEDRLVPDVLKSINSQKDIILRSPNAERPWQHVLEPLAGYLLLAEKLFTQGQHWAQPWNFGPDESDTQSVSWIVDRLISETNSSIVSSHDETHQPYETQILKLDSSKARKLLGWKNIWSIEQCIQEIAHWNEQWKTGKDMNTVMRASIDRYVESVP